MLSSTVQLRTILIHFSNLMNLSKITAAKQNTETIGALKAASLPIQRSLDDIGKVLGSSTLINLGHSVADIDDCIDTLHDVCNELPSSYLPSIARVFR